MDLIVKVCITALVACVLALMIRDKSEHGAMFVSIAACIVLLVAVVPTVSAIYGYCQRLISATGLDLSLFEPLIKVIIITVCVRVTSELCKDAGEGAIASKVEIVGAAAGLICMLPLVEQALRVIGAL